MRAELLYSDSMGVRSMATFVFTSSHNIFIDASAALGPRRYGLPPHTLEIEALDEAKKRIAEMAGMAEYHIITHYHYDHYDPHENFYIGKKIFAKDINSMINRSQMERGAFFYEQFKDKAEIIYADGMDYEIDGVKISFSPPFPHGPRGTKLGYVIMVTIEENEKLLFSSDVQGPVDEDAMKYIIEQEPDMIIMDGPPSYFVGWKFSHENLRKAEQNMIKIMEKLDCTLILDHHLLRDLNYRERMHELYAMYGDRIMTFAEYNGRENNMLEAMRKELWQKYEI
ncbi:MAG: MBL fold metallo-hydrolase [Thermoplasmata archaeon]|nr:MBL fold metallo-hydrolase [Thermoplasmata archaeon]